MSGRLTILAKVGWRTIAPIEAFSASVLHEILDDRWADVVAFDASLGKCARVLLAANARPI
jgi:hypothetical protein